MAEAEAKVVIPESVLKKRKRAEEWAAAKKQELDVKKKKDKENRKLIFSRALQYSKEYETQVRETDQNISFLCFFIVFLMISKMRVCYCWVLGEGVDQIEERG